MFFFPGIFHELICLLFSTTGYKLRSPPSRPGCHNSYKILSPTTNLWPIIPTMWDTSSLLIPTSHIQCTAVEELLSEGRASASSHVMPELCLYFFCSWSTRRKRRRRAREQELTNSRSWTCCFLLLRSTSIITSKTWWISPNSLW